MNTRRMLMESKPKPKPKSTSSSSSINGRGVEVASNTEPSDHWKFLEEIEAPMWADLSVCDLTDDSTDDPWFNISHEFHQCSSSQLISNVFHPTNSKSIKEPSSPKLPASVSKSRGKNYKTKQWEPTKCKAIPNKQHPIKTLTKKSSTSTRSDNKVKPICRTRKLKEEEIKACSSSGSNTSDLADNTGPKSSSSSITKQEQENSSRSTLTHDQSEHQENKCFEVSFQTSSQSSKLLASLRMSLRRSYATRPATRMVVANGGRCSDGSSNNPSVGHPSSKKYIPGDAQNKLKTQKAPALNVGSLSHRQGNKVLASIVTTKEKVQQHASVGKVLIARSNNIENQRIDKEKMREGIGRCTASRKTMVPCPKDKSGVKADQLTGRVQKASMTQKNGTKKLTGLKEKTTNQSRDKDTAIPARKVYFR
ncbi:hypothetical protein SSX86_005859 [Deinandra increscens subsp. villosa]|uniref:Uncharacterized protein n=1 Tax=Deinandra increscens subsp. villosa TaxID=3103831 RepID=A0AAP0DRT1_9ASTR